MEIESETVMSGDSFAKYGRNERCRVSQERVQDFLDRGIMSQDHVYRRYTKKLSEKLISARRSEQPLVIEDVRRSFQQLRDPKTGYVSEAMFKHAMTKGLFELGVDTSSHDPAVLFDVCRSHAFFPFPTPKSGSEQVNIDEEGFVRAVCLLTLSPAPRYGPKFSTASHRCYSGTWGPHHGSYIAVRGKDASDFRRRLFRSLATTDSTSAENTTTISVPRFMWYEDAKSESDSADDMGKELVVAEDESELSIDIVDVLAECPPESDTLTMNPLRESYRIALSSLPQQIEDLSTLSIASTRLVAFMKLVQEVQHEGTEDLVITIQELGSDGRVDWKTFDSVTSENSELLADGLSKIFDTFTVPSPDGTM